MFHEMAKPLQEELGGLVTYPLSLTPPMEPSGSSLLIKAESMRFLAPETSIGGMQAPDEFTQPMTVVSFPRSAVATRTTYPRNANQPIITIHIAFSLPKTK